MKKTLINLTIASMLGLGVSSAFADSSMTFVNATNHQPSTIYVAINHSKSYGKPIQKQLTLTYHEIQAYCQLSGGTTSPCTATFSYDKQVANCASGGDNCVAEAQFNANDGTLIGYNAYNGFAASGLTVGTPITTVNITGGPSSLQK